MSLTAQNGKHERSDTPIKSNQFNSEIGGGGLQEDEYGFKIKDISKLSSKVQLAGLPGSQEYSPDKDLFENRMDSKMYEDQAIDADARERASTKPTIRESVNSSFGEDSKKA